MHHLRHAVFFSTWVALVVTACGDASDELANTATDSGVGEDTTRKDDERSDAAFDADARASDRDAGPPTKEQARTTVGSWERDLCEAYGWYSDGECDDFCPQPDPACAAPADQLARETALALNRFDESSCKLHGIMRHDKDGGFYYGGLTMTDRPPVHCETVAAGACFIRRCTKLDSTKLDIPRDLEAGVWFRTNEERGSSNPSWRYGSTSDFRMPARGGDIKMTWRFDGAEQDVIAPAPSVVSALDFGGRVRLSENLVVGLTYLRTVEEESAPASTVQLRITGQDQDYEFLPDSIECAVSDTVSEITVDRSLLSAFGFQPGYHLLVSAGGYLTRFADFEACRAASFVLNAPPGMEKHVDVDANVEP